MPEMNCRIHSDLLGPAGEGEDGEAILQYATWAPVGHTLVGNDMRTMNITPDLPFLNIHNLFANERISVHCILTNIVACLWTQGITLLHTLATCLRAWL